MREIERLSFNGTTRLKKRNQLFEYQHLLLVTPGN